jgi:spermidine synthase
VKTKKIARISFALGLVSASIIAFEISLMQILAIVQWYHFAYMIISVALLGFGMSGTILALSSKWFVKNFDSVLPGLIVLAGVAMPAALWCSQTDIIRFDSYLIFTDFRHVWRLVLTYLIFFVPFLLGALAIGLTFITFPRHIGALYCANLAGSGAGGIVLILLVWLFLPERLPALISLACIVSGMLVLDKKSVFAVAAAILSCIIPVFFIFYPPQLRLSEFKDMSRALDLPDAKVEFSRNSPYGLVQIISSSALRYAPGLSLAYEGEVFQTDGVFINGDWYGPVWNGKNQEAMNYSTGAVAYELKVPGSVLILDAGTGADIYPALKTGTLFITAVEPNALVVDVLEKSVDQLRKSRGESIPVNLVNMNSRTYLEKDTSQYDLIVLPQVGSFGGASGLGALKEQYLLTTQAFSRIWQKLRPEGMMVITVWMDYPGRSALRIVSTIVEALHENGVNDPRRFIAAIKGWSTMTFMVKRSPINIDERTWIRSICRQRLFDPILLEDITAEEMAHFNRMEDEGMFALLDEAVSGRRERLYENYEFAIYPATDNRPYFSQFLRLKTVHNLAHLFGTRQIPFFEIGYVLVILTLVQIGASAALLIAAPFLTMGWKKHCSMGVLVYFGSIGIGYMFVEIVFIQQFILYFGNIIYSASAVISMMLIFSGIGSYLSSQRKDFERSLPVCIGVIVCLLFLAAFGIPVVVHATISMPALLKLVVAFFCIAPISVIMGVAFPIGIMLLQEIDARSLPWAWGINGCFSVISTSVATIIAVEGGFFVVMLFAAFSYSLALAAHLRWFRSVSIHV